MMDMALLTASVNQLKTVLKVIFALYVKFLLSSDLLLFIFRPIQETTTWIISC